MPSAQQLIGELVDESIRARQRRVHIVHKTEATLYALKAVDAKLDDNLRAMACFGFDALNACERQCTSTSHSVQDAAVHLLCAIAVQMPPDQRRNEMLLAIVKRYWQNHTQAITDALAFFPVGLSEFDVGHGHIMLLLNQADATLRYAGAHAAARCGALGAGAWCARQLDEPGSPDPALQRACEMVLACFGLGLPGRQRMEALLNGPSEQCAHALELLAYSGQTRQWLTARQCLNTAQTDHPKLRELAWCLAALADAKVCAAALDNAPHIQGSLRHNLYAFTGLPRTVIHTVDAVCTQEETIPSVHHDTLLLLLGNVPVAAKQTPIDPELRQAQLRAQVLQTFRHSHVSVNNEADVCAWEAEKFLPSESLGMEVRLRYGQRRTAPQPQCIPNEIASRISAPLRQLLYWEQAHAQNSSYGFGLSALANARAQYSVINAAQWHDEHLARRSA